MGGTSPSPKYFDIIDSLDEVLENLRIASKTDFNKNIDVTEILDLCRSARHPSISWQTDFVEPRPEMDEVKELIKSIDNSIFVLPDSIKLKSNISADIYQLSAFNNIRAHMRSEDGRINQSLKIYENFYNTFYDDLDLSRKANLNYSYAMALLSDGKYEECWKKYEELWYLLKYCDPDQRFKSGILDSWSLLNHVFWFFVKHIEEFRYFLSSKLKIHNKDLWNHKKISYLHILHDDHTWVVSLMGKGFYDHACSKMTNLPKYIKPKPYIPRNDRSFYSQEKIPQADDAYQGQQRIYADKWNRQCFYLMNRSGEYDYFLSEDYKYSFFYFENDHNKDFEHHTKLLEFLINSIDISGKDIIYAGCGNAPVLDQMENKGANVECVDISEQVVFEGHKQAIHINHSPIERYIVTNYCDVLFMPDLITHLNRNKYVDLIKDASCTAPYICALIEIEDDIRELKYEHLEKRCNLHQINENPSWHASIIREHYDIIASDLSEDKKTFMILGKKLE